MYYFIVNPNSRSGNGKLVWQEVERELDRREAEYRVFFTSYRYHATQLAREITSRRERLTLIAVGGDGTVNEVINGILDFSGVTFAYIPTGSSNDFARNLSLPCKPLEAIQNILHPSCFRKIDLGVISSQDRKRHFAGSSGCGFDAAVCVEAATSRLKNILNRIRLGKLTYVGIALKQILLSRPVPMTLILDNNQKLAFHKVQFIAVLNSRYEGGGLKLCPKARPDDGLLDICVVDRLGKLTIALMFPTAYIGMHTIFRGIHLYRAREAEIHFQGQVPCHVDGETFYLKDSIHFSCIPDALTIIAGKD